MQLPCGLPTAGGLSRLPRQAEGGESRGVSPDGAGMDRLLRDRYYWVRRHLFYLTEPILARGAFLPYAMVTTFFKTLNDCATALNKS
jgi:hypothetical protein